MFFFNTEFISTLTSIIFFYNLYFIINRKYPFLKNNIINYIKKLQDEYTLLCEHNPFIIEYNDKLIQSDDSVNKEFVKEKEVEKVEGKYEDKYLSKFKIFPNEYKFTELELELEKKEFEKIKLEYEKGRFDIINEIQQKLDIIEEIQTKGNFSNNNDAFTENLNEFGANSLVKYFNLEEEYREDPDDIDFEDLYIELLSIKEDLLKKMSENEKMILTEEDMRTKAHEIMVNKKLDKYIDNYVLECTPLGNIYMRYNNDKKSFEYFSNNSIPYRFLEPVGRKYVMTYWCKPLFIDIELELKKAEEKYEEDKKQEEKKKVEESNQINSKIKGLKSYNKDSNLRPMKNRPSNNLVLPPQIKAKLPDVNKTSEKQLLKENANRYTWEGRLTNFCPLKKIDRKVIDKKLAMTYAEFKKLQQEQQNKK